MSNPAFQRYVEVPGSARQMPVEATHGGPLDPEARIEVSVYLRSRAEAAAGAVPAPDARTSLTREEYAARFGADPADMALLEQFARAHGLEVVEQSLPRRVIVLAGTVAAMTTAFRVDLRRYELRGKAFRGRSGPVHVPEELAAVVTGVFGLDDRPQAAREGHGPILIRAEAATASYTPVEIARAYSFPTSGNGSGQTIALIELGGGYQQSDLDTYFRNLDLTPPSVQSVSVDGGTNSPSGDPNSADGEVVLDIEVAGGVAPGARIVVYFAPNTDRGFLDAITTAIHDTTYTPSVISISWGGPESNWTTQAQQQMSSAFRDGGSLGVTVCCAAGDNGAGDGVGDGLTHVDFPASSPYALACGGTRLEASNGIITSETVWNDGQSSATGGGVSDTFALPDWQAHAGVPPSINPGGHVGRGVPDVAGNADPQTGYQVLVDGQAYVIGGTSAVAPLWAGLIALLNEQLGRAVGYLNPVLYQQVDQKSAFHDITTGNNNGYSAGPGWDACTGLGSPVGTGLLAGLQAIYQQPATVPTTVESSAPPASQMATSAPAAQTESPVSGTTAAVVDTPAPGEHVPVATRGGMFSALRRLFGGQ